MNLLTIYYMSKDQLVLKRENPNNMFITEDDVSAILAKYDIILPINDIKFFQRAFVHRSYLKVDSLSNINTDPECTVPLQEACNERLELLGDCILGSVVGTYLFTRFDDQPEGFLTKTKTKIVRGKTLGKLSRRMGFGKWVIISLHVENEGGRDNIRILEDLFECFIGALYLDNGGDPLSTDWFKGLNQLKEKKKELMELEKRLLKERDSEKHIFQYVKAVNSYIKLSDQIISTR